MKFIISLLTQESNIVAVKPEIYFVGMTEVEIGKVHSIEFAVTAVRMLVLCDVIVVALALQVREPLDRVAGP